MVLETVLWATLALVTLWAVLYVIGVFNSGVGLNRTIDKNFANIDSVLKQRFDELPKLVNACQAYMQHEQGVLGEVTRLRSAFEQAQSVDDKVRLENSLASQLGQLRVQVEAYPVLKADQQFLQINQRIAGLEASLNDRREQFNESVTSYNIFVEQFPARVFTGMFGFHHRALLETPEAEKANPKLFPTQSA
jgi:LemA protein